MGAVVTKEKIVGDLAIADAGQILAGLAVRDTGHFNSIVFYNNIMS